MLHATLVPPTTALAHSTADIAGLLAAARRVEEPLGRLVELSCLVPCDAAALAAAPLELRDPVAGTLKVRSHPEWWSEVALGTAAGATVDALAAGRWHGALLLDPYGDALDIDGVAQDFAAELIARVDPAIAPGSWTFASIQQCVCNELASVWTGRTVILCQMALYPAAGSSPHADFAIGAQRRSADAWARTLHVASMRPVPRCIPGEDRA